MGRELDPEICACILEFLVHKSPDDMLLKKLIRVFPPLNPSPRLKKSLLLRSIQNVITAGEIPEKLLDYLEMISRIETKQRVPIPDSMRDAYCAVAMDCTTKFLAGSPDSTVLYSDAVNRIWRGRIENLERSEASGLVSKRLRNLRRQVEAAFGDEEVVRRLVAINTRADAFFSLRLYLREAVATMGPPLLERAWLGFTVGQS
ncbi:Leucine-rich repeat transmembrane protein kinase isoform 1 [Hibiscus syriacus]|uniref:Leucine-rich repeat transmembrane protein kinase isoform 1 n=1 Tax=Hibiscus syriacus TaxID=106335 RepID=A0A6A2ZYX4_HIBSY|nr:uncharacterized protein LOC120136726 [Hibiscus syriacus]XP_039008617.1 uncharacterized protein LOC120136726 [Hibiscus syriacus]KAE8696923.1 Leucine-rich repeat transmembrane protein kinase isoform 1 [Hibiscus syriacus]